MLFINKPGSNKKLFSPTQISTLTHALNAVVSDNRFYITHAIVKKKKNFSVSFFDMKKFKFGVCE